MTPRPVFASAEAGNRRPPGTTTGYYGSEVACELDVFVQRVAGRGIAPTLMRIILASLSGQLNPL